MDYTSYLDTFLLPSKMPGGRNEELSQIHHAWKHRRLASTLTMFGFQSSDVIRPLVASAKLAVMLVINMD